MPNISVCESRCLFDFGVFYYSRRRIVWSLLALTLLFAFGVEAYGQTRKTGTLPAKQKPPVAGRQTSAATLDDDLPNDSAIIAEGRRIEAQKAKTRQQLESVLLARNTTAQTWSKDLWRGFRQTFPFHSQVIALSDPSADGSRTLIVSEPPPYITLAELLTTVGGDLLLAHQVKKHIIGYDGWVKDVVIAVRGNDAELQAALSRLNQRLFFTSYKSYTLKLPVSIRAARYDLNLTVTPEEMKRWVVDDAEQFLPVGGGSAKTLAGMTAESVSNVYLSRKRGLIGWWIPAKRHIHECRVQARQFALDADLVIGAISTPAGILALGRERVVPVDILPPLRVETLTLLADVQEGQGGMLAQSYERNHEFAGRVENGWDWAPILLSPELRDTEYGSLLNITDQLLKGWSNNGETSYVNFDYPTPPRWPFPAPLSEVLKAKQLTYNWNTKGVGYEVDFGNVRILALNRSGSLPVSYIPDGMGKLIPPEVNNAQETGYNYFSSLSDANLVRVVQYAALYQIFSAFNIARSPEPIPADKHPGELIESLTKSLQSELQRASNAELNELARQTAFILFDRKTLEEQLAPKRAEETEQAKKEIDAELRKAKYPPGSKQYKEQFDRIFSSFQKDQAERFERSIDRFYQTRTEAIKHQLDAVKFNRPARDSAEESLRRQTLSGVASLKRLPQRYAEAIDSRAKGWVHTSVVVLSRDKRGHYIGGHNLDAWVTKLAVDDAIPVGQVKVAVRNGYLVLLVNSKDAARARGLARKIEQRELVFDLVRAVNGRDQGKIRAVEVEMANALVSAETVNLRPRETALNFSAPPPNKPPNKPPISTGEPGPAGGAGWGGGGREPILVPSERRDQKAIRIKWQSNGRYDLEYGLVGSKEAFGLKNLTHEDAVDVAILEASRRSENGEPVVIEFDGMSADKALATLRSMETRQTGAVELVGFRAGELLPASETKIVSWQNGTGHRIGVSAIETLPDGRLSQTVALEVTSSRQPRRFDLGLIFDKLTPSNVVAAVRARVTRAFSGIAKRFRPQDDVATYNKQLMRAVKKIKTRTKLEFDFSVGEKQGVGDIYIGQRGQVYGKPEFGAWAGQTE